MSEQTVFNIITVVAILSSPLVALWVQRKLDEERAQRQRKIHIFRTLMATRASGLSPAHVEALNSIDVEFYATETPERRVINKWREYLDHLNQLIPDKQTEADVKNWGDRQRDLLAELLLEMGQSLGFSFDKVMLKRSSYYPRAFGELDVESIALRKAALEVFSGKRALPVVVVDAATTHTPAQATDG